MWPLRITRDDGHDDDDDDLLLLLHADDEIVGKDPETGTLWDTCLTMEKARQGDAFDKRWMAVVARRIEVIDDKQRIRFV